MPADDAVAELTAVFQEHRPKLERMLRWRIDPVLAGRLDVDDLLQETFLQAHRLWSRYDPSRLSPYAWLYRIARDCLIAAWRRETRQGRDPHREMPWPEQSSIQFGLSLVGNSETPSAALALEERRRKIRTALEGLKPHDREILEMRDVQDIPFRDIAALLEISENAAMQRYSRAIRKFQAIWSDAASSG